MFDVIFFFIYDHLAVISIFASCYFVHDCKTKRRILTTPWHYYLFGVISTYWVTYVDTLPKG